MENREQQILSEIKSMMSSIRRQLEMLDAKMAELQQEFDPQEIDMVPIDLDIDFVAPDFDLPAEDGPVVEEPVSEEPAAEEPVEEESVEEEPVVLDIPVIDVPATEPEVVVPVEEVSVDEVIDDDDLPFAEEPESEPEPEPAPESEPELILEAEPAPVPVNETVPAPKQAVIDAMTAKQAWRTDMPGTQVKDIRSAISLNDRIFFINYLFNEDPMAFQDALTRINQMTSLDEVVQFAVAEHPDWDLDSDVVYRFMMAVRRRIR
ncbi:MAG: hypothetical protein E7124_06105 [Bacteroidales bacterium]|nr:hypothetical protein [Bacteroidales bacterium]